METLLQDNLRKGVTLVPSFVKSIIRDLTDGKNMSHGDIAKALGLKDKNAISQYKRGAQMDDEHFERLAQIYPVMTAEEMRAMKVIEWAREKKGVDLETMIRAQRKWLESRSDRDHAA